MKASFVDLRKKSSEVLHALDRNEAVVVCYRGRPKAIMRRVGEGGIQSTARAEDHVAFGLWANRGDLNDVAASVRRLRRSRFHDL